MFQEKWVLAQMRRWARLNLIAECFVEFNGKPVASVKKGFKSAVGLASLSGKVTPHTLRHTAATWLMQRGVPMWEAAGFLGMSAEVPGRVETPFIPQKLQRMGVVHVDVTV
jgi:integrase